MRKTELKQAECNLRSCRDMHSASDRQTNGRKPRWRVYNKKNNNRTKYMVQSSWLRAIARIHPVHLMNA